MGRARFAEIGKRVSGGGKCNFSARKEGKFHRPPPSRVGVITNSISGKPASWNRLSGTVSCKQQVPRLSQKPVASRLWPLAHPEPGRPVLGDPLLPGAQLHDCSWGSTEVFRGLPPCGAPGGGEFLSHIPAGRLLSLGSSRAGPGPLSSFTPSVILSSVWPRNYRDNVFSEAPQTMESYKLSWTVCLGGGAGTR